MASKIKVDQLETVDGTGNITVNQPLSGSGAGLTSLPAANLTGSLPAISGASLTGIPAANITGVIPPANLGTGTASSSTFLNGSGAYSAAGGGAWEVLESVTISTAVASVDFTNTAYFPSGSNSYAIIFSNVRPVTNGAQIHCRFGDSSAFWTDSSYSYHIGETGATSNSYAAQSGSYTTHMRLCPNQGAEVREACGATIFLHGMSDANTAPRLVGTYTASNDGGNAINGFIGGARMLSNTNNATQRFQFYYSSGNIQSGKITLYKIKTA